MSKRNALGLGDYGSEDEDDGPNPVLVAHSEDEELGSVPPSERSLQERELGDELERECTPDRALDIEDVAQPMAEIKGEGEDPVSSTSGMTDGLESLPEELQQPPPGAPPEDFVEKCIKMLSKKSVGLLFNDQLRKNKAYRNPDLLTKLVEHWQVDQYGSAFDKICFDPAGLNKEDKIGSLLTQLERDQEKKKQMRDQIRPEQLRAGAGIEFQRGQAGLGILPAALAGQKGTTTSLSAVMAINQAAAVAAAAKRSKWDANSGQK
ncbi:hypothetical protein CEUSTIGMA_g10094.t1 [Chlamydomonas eustigma]|uniref:Uncharacterized protein n=1 Tax=Chlamydomonas eustigma TaxID=1157962 RepID=A0A250XHX0_9CHLO|nr:hypothetical protein CEUSTIGMA_g10094.t1 [Chlamydomonas eustigma]|eukprot:GAX82668.1 hypothetical protein CEUSTIGMA_g10094.t1 [Chlamydomonas eustigma]